MENYDKEKREIKMNERIKKWFKRSQSDKQEDNYDNFDKFIALWIAFNGWANIETNKTKDSELIKEVSKSGGVLGKNYKRLLKDDSNFRSNVEALKSASPVYDMRYLNDSDKAKEISNIENLGEVLKVIYQIRCNLFHGAKDLEDTRDNNLVKLAYDILTELFKKIVEEQ
jgi:hypothetical protein